MFDGCLQILYNYPFMQQQSFNSWDQFVCVIRNGPIIFTPYIIQPVFLLLLKISPNFIIFSMYGLKVCFIHVSVLRVISIYQGAKCYRTFLHTHSTLQMKESTLKYQLINNSHAHTYIDQITTLFKQQCIELVTVLQLDLFLTYVLRLGEIILS